MSGSTGVTDALARFVAGVRYDRLPPAVVDKAKGCLLDFLGAAAAGSLRPHCRDAVAMVDAFGGAPQAAVIGERRRTSSAWAAYLNGMFGSSTPQQDDVWKESLGHPGVGVLPAALAAGEAEDADGRRLIEAIVAGYEISMRIGSAVGKEGLARGWHPRGGLNHFAAATAAAKAMGIDDPETHRTALSLGGNTASGTTGACYYYDAWFTLSANASLAGVLAAHQARAGLTSGPEVLEADHGGYLRLVVEHPDWDALTAGLGEGFEIVRIGQKIHASSGATHAAVDATLLIVEAHDIGPDDVELIRIWGFDSMVGRTGRPYPQNLVHAGMSVPFLVAVAIRDRRVGLDQTAEASRNDPIVRKLQGLMELTPDPELEALAPKYLGARVEMTLKDGRVLTETVTVPRGDAENPLTSLDLESKFVDLAGRRFPPGQVAEIVAAVASLDSLDSVGELGSLLLG